VGDEGEIDLLDWFAELTIYTTSSCLIGRPFREELDSSFARLYHELERGTDAIAYVDPYADIWNRPGLSDRDRRLLLIGLLTGRGSHDVLTIQVPAALSSGDLDAEALREVVVFLSHYAGWPDGAGLNSLVEETIAQATG
jgi:alkylhydroperoxidase/carboxymuconolactone decarboxylase family protein YurZ